MVSSDMRELHSGEDEPELPAVADEHAQPGLPRVGAPKRRQDDQRAAQRPEGQFTKHLFIDRRRLVRGVQQA